MNDKDIKRILRAKHGSKLVRIAKLKDDSECAILIMPALDYSFSIIACKKCWYTVETLATYLVYPWSGSYCESVFKRFFDLSKTGFDPSKEDVYTSQLEVNFDKRDNKSMRNKGLGTIMLEELVKEMDAIKAFHIVSFTNDGLAYLKKKYDALNYTPLNVTSDPPEFFQGLSGWMYKNYAEKK